MGVLPEIFNVTHRTSVTIGDGWTEPSLAAAYDETKHSRDPHGRWAAAAALLVAKVVGFSKRAVDATAKTGDQKLLAQSREAHGLAKKGEYRHAAALHQSIAKSHRTGAKVFGGHSMGGDHLSASQHHEKAVKMLKLDALYKAIGTEAAAAEPEST